MFEYLNWLIGHIYYKWIRLFGEPFETYEDDEWHYEVDYFNFGIFTHKHIHAERKNKNG